MTTLRASNLAKSYKSRVVVRDLSLQVAAGEIVGLLGPNGAGKTTAFYMIVGLVPCDAGRIEIGDKDVTRLPMHRRARLGLGYLPQETSVFRGLDVEQNIMAIVEMSEGRRDRAREITDELLRELHIEKLRNVPAAALSGGDLRRGDCPGPGHRPGLHIAR